MKRLLRGLVMAVGLAWLAPTLVLEIAGKLCWFGMRGLDRLYSALEEE